MKPYAELLEFNQPNPIRLEGFTRIRDQFKGLSQWMTGPNAGVEGYSDPERIMEFAGSWDYGENNALKLGTRDGSIIQRWLASGEESMIEMGHATFFIECSRVVSHELVRHRLASYQQESQRFVSYKNGLADQLTFLPPEIESAEENVYVDENGISDAYEGTAPLDEYMTGISAQEAFEEFMSYSLTLYNELIAAKVPKQIARYVLTNATRTRMIVSANTREWRHILKLRLDKSAQPEMRQVMQQIYDQLVMVFPNALSGVLDNGRGVR